MIKLGICNQCRFSRAVLFQFIASNKLFAANFVSHHSYSSVRITVQSPHVDWYLISMYNFADARAKYVDWNHFCFIFDLYYTCCSPRLIFFISFHRIRLYLIFYSTFYIYIPFIFNSVVVGPELIYIERKAMSSSEEINIIKGILNARCREGATVEDIQGKEQLMHAKGVAFT